MKKLNLIPILLLSLFLCNCLNSHKKLKSDEQMLIDSIKNEELKDTMIRLANGVQIENPDFLLLPLDEDTDEETQIKILDFLITRTENKTSPQDIHPVVFRAIEKKKNKAVAFLLTRVHINYKATDGSGNTLLHAAVAKAPEETVHALLLFENGKLINAKSATHGTPLHYLLEAPFELNGKPTNDIKTRKEILELLLRNGKIKPEIKNRKGHTALERATKLAEENEEAANAVKTPNATLKQTYVEREEFYKWAAEKIAEKVRSNNKKK